MPDINLVIITALGLIGVVVLWLAVRMGGSSAATEQRLTAVTEALTRMSESQSALGGRLAQIGEGLSTTQARVAETLQAQERAVTKTLDERLAEITRRVGENLQKSGDKTTATLTQLQERLAVIDAAQKNIAELSADVVGLQDLLSNKQARGAIGQTQMEDLVRNMLPANAYEFQFTLSNGKRADCVIKLPNPPGLIAVDAKYPHDAYARWIAAADDAAATAAERDFRNDVLKHIKDIADKYIIPGETADSAIMFVPAESVFAELHDRFPAVIEDGFRRRVYIVSPTTMMATLNTVRAVLKDIRMREQAHVIQREVGELIRDVERLDKRVGNLASHFEQARKDVDEIQVSARKIVKRGSAIEDIPLEGTGESPQQVGIAQASPQPRSAFLQ
ncbi:MAG: DNA recombination protein RmuC [Alphaproteobacteria bacterium]|nr:DNA recombination protein RmuC [Alphaproteobacteria bacterium]